MKVRVNMTVVIPDNWYKGKVPASKMRQLVIEEFIAAQNYVLGNVLETLEEEDEDGNDEGRED